MFFGGELGSRIGVVAPQSRFFELKEISSKKPKSVCSSLVGSRATILSGRWLPVNGDAASGAFAIVAAKITIWYVRSTGSAVPSHLSASSQNARGEIPCELFNTLERALSRSAFLFWRCERLYHFWFSVCDARNCPKPTFGDSLNLLTIGARPDASFSTLTISLI